MGKCPICGDQYRDYIKHIWTHKARTVKWLAAKRKGKPRKKSRVSTKSDGQRYCSSCGKEL